MAKKLELNKEYVQDNEEETIRLLVEHEKTILRKRYTEGGFLRDFHAKSQGGVKAKFIVEPDLPDEYRHGVFHEAKTYPSWIRFSSGGEEVKPDYDKDVRGVAIKLMGVPGPKLLERDKDTESQDFIFFTPETFFTRDAPGFLEFITEFHKQEFRLLRIILYSIRNPKVYFILRQSLQRVANLLEIPYFSATPYLLGDRAVKYGLRPTKPRESKVPPESQAAPNYLRERLVEDLSRQEARFDFLIQFQTDPVKTPIEDAQEKWQPSIAPFFKVATVVIPPQTFDTEERNKFIENLSMNAWHALPAHRPLGNVNRVRKGVYDGISQFRHEMNQELPAEPTAGDDFFDIPRPDPFPDRQADLAKKFTIAKGKWSNWEDSFQCETNLCEVRTLRDIREVIDYAKRNDKTIRVSGGGLKNYYSGSFSGSPVVENEDQIIVYMPRMNRAFVHADDSKRITVEAGMLMGDLSKFALKHGLCLPTCPVPTFIQAAGAVATSSHGCGRDFGTISDQVVAMEIVTHDGSIRTVSKEDDPVTFRAAQVNLGALGIVRSVTFQCVPRFKLLAIDEIADLDETIANVKNLFEKHDYFELFWFPFTSKAWIKKWTKVPWDTADLNRPNPKAEVFRQKAGAKIGTLGLEFLVKFPKFTPPFSNLLLATTRSGETVAPAPSIFHYTEYFPRKLYDLSYAIDTGKDFEKFQSAWNFVTKRVCVDAQPKGDCDEPWSFCYGSDAKFPQNFLMHARFIKNSDGYLAPAVGFDSTVMMEVITYVGSDCKAFYDDIEKHWQSLGGRPHWGKTYDPSQDFGRLYGQHLKDFNRIRKEFDPDGLFLNRFLKHVFSADDETGQFGKKGETNEIIENDENNEKDENGGNATTEEKRKEDKKSAKKKSKD